ncbi:amino acid adenylation domain-containing protein [Nocardia sp. NPDC127579]|uniref:amino acid adenylation domain-containing protein n=1 Tax=Nocardia sp. NPDC127579 TaxID=3345402 RepID=UPI00362A8AE0
MIPLSFAQGRLWFIHRLEGPSATYNLPVAVRVRGEVDIAALGTALRDVLGRHATLRTRFTEADGVPEQVIMPAGGIEFDWRVIDARSWSAAELGLAIAAEARHPFDLATEIPFRAGLFALAPDEHILVITMHHIATDGWSLRPLWRDLGTAYSARRTGDPPAWHELPVEYLDYALWQRDYLGDPADPGSVLAEQAAFWETELVGVTEHLELPVDRPYPPIADHRGATVPIELSAEIHRGIQDLARAGNATTFMVVQAALAVLLARWSGSDDVAVGIPTAGRTDAALEDLIGFFVNTLVLRTDTSGNPSFRTLLDQVRQRGLDAYAHQDIPFDVLVDRLRPARSLTRNPIVGVLLAWQNAADADYAFDGLAVEAVPIHTGTARADLTIDLTERRTGSGQPAGIIGTIEYRTDVFDAATIERFARLLCRVSRAAVTAPDASIATIDLLTPDEHAALAEQSNIAALTANSSAATITERFAEQVARTPDAVAVTFEEQTWTYRRLDQEARALAHRLVRAGVGTGDTVALLLPRSAEAIMAILAVLRAGAAYVPIDIQHPDERIAFVLADARPAAAITTPAQAARVAGRCPIVLAIAEVTAAHENASEPGSPLAAALPRVAAHDLAYLIYTSGTTGTPKGVAVTHANVTQLFESVRASGFSADAGQVWTQFHSYAFDFSVWEIWGALLHGGRLVVVPEAITRSAPEFYDLLVREQVTVLNQTPSAFLALQAAEELRDAPPGLHLETLIFGGEALDPTRLLPWWRHHSDRPRLINMYGTTETTVHASFRPIEAADASRGGSPIGEPLSNLALCILDSTLHPAPAGVAGELYIAGGGVAREYHRRPDLTASRFVACPFGPPGTRMYRTGDLVRRTTSGALEYLGRRDKQVKIRGFRIELGEIEATLAAVDGVDQAVVLVRADLPGTRQLVGYVTGTVSGADARAAIALRLPPYMVPVAIVVLAAFPLTVNGKLDEKALPAPEFDSGQTYRAPSTPTEKTLAEIFARVLGVELVGLDESFFDLGGHSLLAMRVVAAAERDLGTPIAVESLFQHPTVAGLAAIVADPAGHDIRRGPFERSAREELGNDALPLSAAQRRLWFVHRMEGPSATYNVPIAVRLHGELDLPALGLACRDVVARHESLRTTFTESGGVPKQVIVAAEDVDLGWKITDAANWPQDRLATAIAEHARHEFDLTSEIPFRAQLFTVATDEYLLLITMHHIATDGWSLRPLWRDLSRAYSARRAGRPPESDWLPMQYADYALWQHRYLGTIDDPGSAVAEQLAYWQDMLAGLPERLELPADRPYPPVADHRGATVPVTLPARLHTDIRRIAKAHNATAFMVVHAALTVLLAKSSGTDDIVVGVPTAGRIDAALDELVGCFVNTLVLRTDLSGNPGFGTLLDQVRARGLDALVRQDIPFEVLVDRLQPTRSLTHHPLVQVLLTWQSQAVAEIGLDGIEVSPVPIDAGAARADLTFSLEETFTAAGAPAGIEGIVEYRTDVFDAATVDRFVRRLARVLASATADPDTPISTIDLLDEPERRALAVHGNRTALVRQRRREQSIPERFADQVARTPDATAVVCATDSLTYRQLAARADRLAGYLRGHGVGSGDRVALLLPRSLDAIVAILAVLRAGAAYVPIDVGYPDLRVAFILRDAAPAAVLTTEQLRTRAAGHVGTILTVDRHEVETCSNTPLPQLIPDAPAYLIYTSGTTGTPKGVIITHADVARMLRAVGERMELEGQVWTQFHSYAFDFSVWEIWGPLLHAGRLVVVPESVVRSPVDFARLLHTEQVSVLSQTPSAFYALQDAAPRHDFPDSLTTVVFGGEKLEPHRLRQWFDGEARSPRFVNMYGTTESTVHASFHEVTAHDIHCGAGIVGAPLDNLAFFVLDAGLRYAPTGVTGELYVAGQSLALGYHDRPGLTATRFVANPFDPSGRRLYRTGDLARWMADGGLEYLGRRDDQVKIRGYRIELGEVRAALAAAARTDRTVVVAREDRPGDKRLVGYVVGPADERSIRAGMGERLPEFMVPAAVVSLDALPLTPNGKLDTAALPAPDFASGKAFRAPSSVLEATLAELFTRVLGVPRIGLDDSFFDLGGHSLLAVRLASSVRSELDLDLPIRTIFEAPTVAELARRFDDEQCGSGLEIGPGLEDVDLGQ